MREAKPLASRREGAWVHFVAIPSCRYGLRVIEPRVEGKTGQKP